MKKVTEELLLRKMLQKYGEVFPEVMNKASIFEKASFSFEEKVEQFLVYTYWYFDEYYSVFMKKLVSTEKRRQSEASIDCLIGEVWEKSTFQLEFFYTYRNLTNIFHCMSYLEFSEYSSLIENHKFNFFES